MRKRKFKFITSVLSLVVLVSVLIVGVYSMTKRQVTITGTISFISTATKMKYELYITDKDGFDFRAIDGVSNIPYNQIATLSDEFSASKRENVEEEIGEISLNDIENSFAFKVIFESQETESDIIIESTLPTISQENTVLKVFKKTDTEDGTVYQEQTISDNKLNISIVRTEIVELHYLFTVNGLDNFLKLDIDTTFVFSKS